MPDLTGNERPPTAPQTSTRFSRWWLWTAVALVAAAGGWVWLHMQRAVATAYVTAPASRGAVTRAVTATGTVNPVLTVLVGSYVSGVIQELFCDYNTRVKRGQVCARIEPAPYQAVVDQQQANLGVANAQLTKDKAALTYANTSFERGSALLLRGMISQDAWDTDKSALDQALAQIQFDQSTILQRAAELRSARVNLAYTEIRSPVDGTVVSRNVTMGQTVAASFQTPTLFLIATDLTKMEVDTNVSESDIGSLRTGDKASFSVEAYPGQTFAAVVTQVRQSPQTVQNVVTYDVVASVDNAGLLLRPGMTATARIVSDSRADVMRVSNQALRYVPRSVLLDQTRRAATLAAHAPAAASAHVWVLRDGKPGQVALTAGIEDDNWTEIVAGPLHEGDRVIESEQDAAGPQPGSLSAPASRP